MMGYRRSIRRQRIPSTTAAVLAFALALVLWAGAVRPAAADELTTPLVGVPIGLSIEGTVSVSPGPAADTEYVTLGTVSVVNPNRDSPQSFALDDWTLVDGDHLYHPKPRPGLGAIDLSSSGVLFPRERFHQTITFIVPRTLRRASLQFTPEWYDQAGARIQYCCA